MDKNKIKKGFIQFYTVLYSFIQFYTVLYRSTWHGCDMERMRYGADARYGMRFITGKFNIQNFMFNKY